MINSGITPSVTHEWTRMAVSHETPVILAAMQTFNGPNTASVRIRRDRTMEGSLFAPLYPGQTIATRDEDGQGIREVFQGDLGVEHPYSFSVFGPTVKIEEEQSEDAEVWHTEEEVGHIAFEGGRVEDAEGNRIGWANYLNTEQLEPDTWQTLPSPSSFTVEDSVVFMQVLSYNEDDPVHVRVSTSNVDTGTPGFYFKLEEWPTYDGGHASELLGYAVLKKGIHPLGGGRVLEVGTTEPFNYLAADDHWEVVEFEAVYRYAVVVTQTQTFNGSDPVVTRQEHRLAHASLEVDVRLQGAEIQEEHASEEVVGYVAIGYRK